MIGRFFRWLGTPIRATRACFPLDSEGRQSLIYLLFAGAGPALCLFVYWAMRQLERAAQWGPFANLAYLIGWALMLVVTGLAMFVSIRAVKIGPFEAGGWRSEDQNDNRPSLPPPPCGGPGSIEPPAPPAPPPLS